MSFEIPPNIVGSSVVIDTSGGIIEGEVQSIDRNCSKIFILNGTLNSKKLPGVYRIFTRDIIKITGKGGLPLSSVAPNVTNGKESVHTAVATAPTISANFKCPPKLAGSYTLPSQKTSSTNSGISMIQKNIPPHIMNLDNKLEVGVLTNKLPHRGPDEKPSSVAIVEYTIVANIGEQYAAMISVLKEQLSIGLSMEGVRVGRHGVICWIGIGIKDHVYLLDMCSLGPAGIDSGLKEILEAPFIKKITHDCRFMSDAFVHQYKVKVENVADTQVAAAVVEKSKLGAFNRFAPTLARCLNEYLGMPVEKMFQPRIRTGHELEDESRWKLRPLPLHLEHGAVFNVCHLKTLYVKLQERLLQEVTIGTELYLKDVSELSDDEYQEKAVVSHLIPVSFEKLTKISGSQNGKLFYSAVPENSCDPYLRFSRHMPHMNKSNVYL